MTSKHTLVLTLGAFAGCATNSAADPSAPAPAPVEAAPATDSAGAQHIDENLARLRALSVIEVGQLIIDAPEGAYSCYGPCPQFAAEIAAGERKSAARLEKFVAAAQAATPDPSPAACEKATIDSNLATLQALKIVGIGALIEDKPKNSPQCYNNPCAADIEAANAKTCERARKLAGITAATKDL